MNAEQGQKEEKKPTTRCGPQKQTQPARGFTSSENPKPTSHLARMRGDQKQNVLGREVGLITKLELNFSISKRKRRHKKSGVGGGRV